MSKRINLDNLKTFLTQLKTHITDPIANDVSTLSVKVRNAENNIITANSNISSVQQALNDKAEKNHNHDNAYSKLGDTGIAWTTPTQSETWSALCQLSGYVSIMFSIDMDQRNQCNHDVFLINTGWDKARIIQLSGNGYYENTKYQLRLVKEISNQYTLELKNDYVYSETKTLNVKCKYITINNNSEGSVDFYNSFTPSTNNSVVFSITTSSSYMVGTISNAIKDSEGNVIKDTYVKKDEKDISTLFVRNDGIINKNINNCFDTETGKFKANESGQYLVMCSGYELPSDTSTYVGCVLSGSSGNQNKLYTKGNLSGFTFITLEKEQTLSLHVCVTGNITHNCISNDNSVNMLIAKIN